MIAKVKKFVISAVLALILSLLLAFAVVKYVAGPAIAKQRFMKYLSNFWAGPVQVEKVKFNLFAPLYFNDVTLLDSKDRQWAHAESFEVTLEDWPSLKMKMQHIAIDSLKLQLHADQPQWTTLLTKPSEDSKAPRKKIALPSAAVNYISVYLVDANLPELIIDDLSFSSQQNETSYEIALATTRPEETKSLQATGTLNLRTMQMHMALQLNHHVKRDHASPMIRLLAGSQNFSGHGHISANVGISGSLKDITGIQPEGTIELADFSLSYKEFDSVVTDINSTIVLSPGNISCKDFNAVAYEGIVGGSFNIDYTRPDPNAITGRIKIDRLQLEELAKDFENLGKAGKGTAEFEFAFEAPVQIPPSIDGHGYIELQNSDLFDKPLTSHIFRLVGLKDQQLTAMTDAACTFTKTGPVITIREAKATSRYGAIVVEPGGIIDLKDNSIDIYVIAVPVRALRGLLQKIPFISIITTPTDKLTRIRVQGNLSDPPNKLIKKQPFRDVAAGTVSFFKEVLETGGDLSKTTADSTRALFESLAGRDRRRKQTQPQQ